MRHDVAARAGAAVGVEAVAQARAEQAEEAAVHGTRKGFAVFGEERQQTRQVRAVPASIDIGVGEADIAAGENLVESALVVHLHRRHRHAIAEGKAGAVGQAHVERTTAQIFKQAKDGAGGTAGASGDRDQTVDSTGSRGGGIEGVHRVVSSRGGTGFVKKGTRLSHSCSACQWMRRITPALCSG